MTPEKSLHTLETGFVFFSIEFLNLFVLKNVHILAATIKSVNWTIKVHNMPNKNDYLSQKESYNAS